MIFQTRYNRLDRIGESNPGPNLVEKAGYIPAKIQIENLILAGIRLKEHRQDLYDFKSLAEIDMDFYDPTRSKNFDLADAFQYSHELKLKARLKASQTSQEAPDEVLNNKKGVDIPLETKMAE